MTSLGDVALAACCELGVQLFIGTDRKLYARPKEKVSADLRAKIAAAKGQLLAELLVAETLFWEQGAYSAADRIRMGAEMPPDHRAALKYHLGAEMPPDHRAALKYHFDAALSACVRGDVEAALAALAKYRTVLYAVAMGVGLVVIRFPDAPTEYPQKTET